MLGSIQSRGRLGGRARAGGARRGKAAAADQENIFASSEKFCLIYNLWFPLLSYSSSVFLDQPTSVSRSVIISLWSRRTRFWLDAFFGAVVWVSRGSGLFHGVTIIHELKRGQSALQPNDVSCTIEEMILGLYLTLPTMCLCPQCPQ